MPKILIKIIRTIVIVSGVILMLLIISYVGGFFEEKEKERIRNNKCTTIGEVIDVLDTRRGIFVTFRAFINGNKIEFKKSAPSNKVLTGECFEIDFNCSNSDERNVLFDHPAFVKGDEGKIGVVKGKIKKFDSDYVVYEYNIHDTLFNKEQAVPENTKIDTSKLYKVGYLKYYPYISIIYFE